MKITVLHNETCPSTADALERVTSTLDNLGEEAEVEVILVTTEAEAAETGFLGSPTILVDGRDIEVVSQSEGGSDMAARGHLDACRIYVRSDGRASPLPPVELIELAIQRARQSEL